MNFASIISIVALVVGVMVAILGLRFGSAPGWGRYRSLAAVGLTAAMYAAFDALWASGVSDEVRWPALCVQGSVSVFHVEQLTVPGLDAERCLIWLRPAAGVT